MSKLYDNDNMPAFCGIHTFHSIPFQDDLKEMDYAVIGIPFDTTAVNRCGSRFAPTYVRTDASFSNHFGYNTILEVIADTVSGTDLGEISVANGYTEPSLAAIENGMEQIYKNETLSLAIGGGQICTLAELRAANKTYGPLALVHLSADRCITPCDDITDGNTISTAAKEGLFDPAKSVQLGMRGGFNSKEEADYLKDKGMKVISASTIHTQPLQETISEIVKQVGDAPCMISLDMSFLDPACAPGVDLPKGGGFSTYETRKMIRELVLALDVKALDIVNIVPMFDSAQLTTQAADGILCDAISACAKKKMNGGL